MICKCPFGDTDICETGCLIAQARCRLATLQAFLSHSELHPALLYARDLSDEVMEALDEAPCSNVIPFPRR